MCARPIYVEPYMCKALCVKPCVCKALCDYVCARLPICVLIPSEHLVPRISSPYGAYRYRSRRHGLHIGRIWENQHSPKYDLRRLVR